jgi:hypothetical protein
MKNNYELKNTNYASLAVLQQAWLLSETEVQQPLKATTKQGNKPTSSPSIEGKLGGNTNHIITSRIPLLGGARGGFFLMFFLISTMWLLSGVEVHAQNNVGIGTTTPNPKALLELNATDKGFIAPRLTTPQMLAIAATATENALLIYNTDSACYHFYNGVAWKNLCQKGLDTAVINSAIKNYLGGVTFTTVINNMLVDSSVTNYAVINNAIVNNITIDSSVINYTIINNATINNLTVDSSSINFTTINNAIVNNITIDSSIVNYTTINNAVINNLIVDTSFTNVSNSNISNINIANIDTSITNVATITNATINNLISDSTISNYSNINNAVIDSLQNNYINSTTGNFTNLTVGGQSISSLINDSISNRAWVLTGNNAPINNKLGTLNANDLHIYAGGLERITILNGTGNVGIGQTLPSAKLDVLGDVKFSGTLQPAGLQGTAGQVLTSNGAGVPTWNTTTVSNTYSNSTGNLSTTVNGVTGVNINLPTNQSITDSITAQAWTLKGNAGTNPNTNFIGTTDNKSVRFRTNNTVKMVIDSMGHVGIGTNNPVYVSNHGLPTLLDVRGSAVVQGRLTLTRYGDAPQDLKPTWHLDNDTLHRAFRIFRQPDIFTNGAIAVWIDSTLKVGIGTTTPKTKLDVNGNVRIFGQSNFTLPIDSSYDLALETNVTNRRFLFGGNANGYTLQSTELSTKNNLIMSLNPLGGNVGVGIIAPTALFHVEKSINAPLTSGNLFIAQHDLFNNSTFTAAGNITANLSRVVNGVTGTMQATAASVVGSESSFTNNGAFNTGSTNTFGTYNSIVNNGTFTIIGEADGSYNRIVNNIGKTMTAPSTKGVTGIVHNEGTLAGSSSFGINAAFENTGVANLSSEIAAGYFNVDNSTGATISSNYTRGVVGVIRNSGVLNGAVGIGVEGGLDFRNGSTTTLTSEGKGGAFYIINAAGATTNIPYSKAAQSYVTNNGTYNGVSMWATENYISNTAALNLTGGFRGGNMIISNTSTGTVTSGDAVAGAINIDNRGTINIANSGTIRAGNMELYNEGTINAGYMQGGVFSVLNKPSASINLSKQITASGSYISNFGTMTAKYAYAGDISFYNKGNLHTGHQRGANIYITNDTAGIVVNDTSYIAAVVNNNNYGTLTTTNQRSLLSEVQNLPGSTTNATNLIATESNVNHSGLGTINSAFAMSLNVVKPAIRPGSIINAYGLYIGTIQGVNRWGIHQADGGAQNYFAGNVGIGNATPTEKLEVQGSVKIVDGTQGAGKVLTSDAAGKASWQSPAGSVLSTYNITPHSNAASGATYVLPGFSYTVTKAGNYRIEFRCWNSFTGGAAGIAVAEHIRLLQNGVPADQYEAYCTLGSNTPTTTFTTFMHATACAVGDVLTLDFRGGITGGATSIVFNNGNPWTTSKVLVYPE